MFIMFCSIHYYQIQYKNQNNAPCILIKHRFFCMCVKQSVCHCGGCWPMTLVTLSDRIVSILMASCHAEDRRVGLF